MIRFILGEDRHVKYFVHSVKGEYFSIRSAAWELRYSGEVEAAGECEITQEENGWYVDARIQPKNRSSRYELEITLEIADEVIKNRESMEVI